jgi:hypothetical protein
MAAVGQRAWPELLRLPFPPHFALSVLLERAKPLPASFRFTVAGKGNIAARQRHRAAINVGEAAPLPL